jgi:hypothetical protein
MFDFESQERFLNALLCEDPDPRPAGPAPAFQQRSPAPAPAPAAPAYTPTGQQRGCLLRLLVLGGCPRGIPQGYLWGGGEGHPLGLSGRPLNTVYWRRAASKGQSLGGGIFLRQA